MPVADDLVRSIDQASQPGRTFTRDVPLTSSPRFLSFSGLYGDNWDRYSNPESIPIESFNQMRFHGVIAAGLTLIKAPILSCLTRATVECDDPKIKAFVQRTVVESGLLYRIGKTDLRAQEFGCAIHEKVFEVLDLEIPMTTTDEDTGEAYDDVAWNGPALVYRDIKEVNPETVLFIRKDPVTREFAGFVQSFAPTWLYSGIPQKQPLPPPQKGADDLIGAIGIPIEAQKAYLFTHDTEYGNLWGKSRLKAAYPYWWWAQVILKYWLAWAERKIVPTRIVRHPVGRDVDGSDYSDVAMDIASKIDDVRVVAVPNTRVREAGSQTGGDYLWDFTEIQTTDKSETFQAIAAWLDTAILRAMFVPERTFTTGQGFGLFSTDAQAHTDTFLMTLDADAADIIDSINEDVVKPLVIANFGSKAPIAKIQVPGLTDEHKEMLREIMTQVLLSPGVADTIDIKRILEELNIPVHDTDIAENAANPNAPATQQQPPAAPPVAPPAPISNVTGAQPASVEPTATRPDNLILEDEVMLDFDSTRWDVEADPKSLSGYKVTDKSTGKTLSGYAGQQVIKSFLTQGQHEAKKAAAAATSAAKKAANQQTAAAKKAANQQAAAAKKAQRDALTAQHKAAAQAVAQQHKAEAAARKAASASRVAQAKAERTQTAAAKAAARQALVTQHKADLAAKQAAAAAVRTQKAADREAAKQARQQASSDKQTQKASAAATSAQVASVKAERVTIQATTKTQSSVDATQTLKTNGYSSLATTSNVNDAMTKATSAANSDPHSIYTVVQAKDGYIVASKPTSAVSVSAGASNAAL